MAINSLSASSHGLSGLVSGMDTQTMVDAMLKGTQSKIDKQTAKKTQLTYKQEMYQTVIAQLKGLQTSFFSATNQSTALNYDSFFNSMTSSTKSTAFRVKAGDTTSTNKMTVEYIKQLAQARKEKSAENATGPLEGKFDAASMQKLVDAAKMNITFEANGKTFTMEDMGKELAGKTNLEAAEILNQKFAAADLGVTAKYENGSFTFTATDADGKATSLLMKGTGTKVFGISSSSASTGSVKADNGIIKKKGDLSLLQPSFDVTLNNVKKRITFDYNTAKEPKKLVEELQKSLNKAFGAEIDVTETAGKITFATGQPSSQMTITGGIDAMKTLGITSGQSNKINIKMAVKELNFKEPVYGENFKFKINGVDFNVTADRGLSQIIDEINSSDAGVKISYVPYDDRFTIESTMMGENTKIEMSQSEGNLLSAMFGVGSGGASQGDATSVQKDIFGTNAMKNDFEGGLVKLTINGTAYGFTIPKIEENPDEDPDTDPVYKKYTAEEFVTEINKQLINVVGTKAGDGAVGNVVFSAKDGKLSIHAERGHSVVVEDQAAADLFGIAQASKTTEKASLTSLIKDLGLDPNMGIKVNIGGVEHNIAITAKDPLVGPTVQDVLDSVNGRLNDIASYMGRPAGSVGTLAFEESTGRFRIFGVDIPTELPPKDPPTYFPVEMTVSNDPEGKFLGNDTLKFHSAGTERTATDGQDAILSVNGVEIHRNTNAFTIDGVGFELLETTQKKNENGDLVFKPDGTPVYDPPATVETSRDTDQIVNGVKKFVEEYNKVVETIQDLLGAKPTYKDYPPLTSAEKGAMSESEIKLWEAKSREGLLRGDEALEGVLSDMRRILYEKSDSSEQVMYGIGITTSSSYSDTYTGKLAFEENKFREKLNEDIEGVRKLFTATDGVATKLNKALDKAASNSSASPGSLVRIAGTSGGYDTSSKIYKELRGIDENLKNLQRTYTSEYNRYWKQFNSMEQMINKMNSQSSWLSSQFS